MKYIIAAIICAFIGVGILQLNANGRENGFYGYTYDGTSIEDPPDFLDSVNVYCEYTNGITTDTVMAETKYHNSYHYFKFSTSGYPPPHWHIGVPGSGYTYYFWAYKPGDTGYWESAKIGPYSYPGTSQNVSLTLFYYEG